MKTYENQIKTPLSPDLVSFMILIALSVNPYNQ